MPAWGIDGLFEEIDTVLSLDLVADMLTPGARAGSTHAQHADVHRYSGLGRQKLSCVCVWWLVQRGIGFLVWRLTSRPI
jgi:hypothetical protein